MKTNPVYLSLLLSSALLLGACSQSKSETGKGPYTSGSEAALTSVQSCDELERYLKDIAIRDMEETLASYRDGVFYRYAYDATEGDRTTANAGTSDSPASPPKHSETNTQEQGVDEADIVKTDGFYTYILADNRFVIAKSFPATEMSLVSSLNVYGSAIEMFVEGDNAIVFSSIWDDAYVPAALKRSQYCGSTVSCYRWRPLTKLSVIDISDRAAPKVTRELYTETNYDSSRRIGDSVRAVTSGYIDGPVLTYWPNTDFGGWGYGSTLNPIQKVAIGREFERLRKANREVIENSTLEDWLPEALEVIYTASGKEEHKTLIASCDEFFRPSKLNGRGVLDVVTANLAKPEGRFHHSTILSHGGVVYASETNLYVATHPWYSWWGWWGWTRDDVWRTENTFVHKFDMGSDADRTRYVASGSIPGHVLNQFSLDEDKGFLRVATSVSPLWGSTGPVTERTNHLFVLGQNEGHLDIASQINDIARGENIYSARFEGDVGFLVTFLQVDPLFAFDLSDPHQPKLMGQLEIPGFSEYMHPLRGEDGKVEYLLTIGRINDSTSQWFNRLALSLFDVRDLKNPQLKHRHIVDSDGAWTSSEAEYNHKAFSYFAEQGLLAIPTASWGYGWNDSFTGLKVFKIDIEAGITPVADISHSSYYADTDYQYRGYYSWWTQVRRSLTIEDHLYSLSGRALVATPLANLSGPPSGVVLLPIPDPPSPGIPYLVD